MSSFAVGGLASGLDTQSIISKLIAIDSQPKQKLQWQQQLIGARKTAWTDLSAKLKSLQTAAAPLLSATAWDVNASAPATSFTYTSGDPTKLAASKSAIGAAVAGTYAINVLQLASSEISVSTGALAGGALGGNETFSITNVDGTVNVALTAGDTKQDIVNKINATPGIGAFATLDGANNIRLLSPSTGAAAGFSVSSSGTAATDLGFVETQTAQDAMISIDGALQTSSENTFNGSLPGVTLTVSGLTNTTVTVKQATADGLSPEAAWAKSMVSKIKEFANAYNATLTQVYTKTQGESKVTTPANKTTGMTLSEYLTGPMARNVQYGQVGIDLRSAVSNSVTGMATAASGSLLSSIGITTSYTVGGGAANGALVVDEAKLTAALTADPAHVQELLTKTGVGAGATADDGIFRRINDLAYQMSTSIANTTTTLTNQSKSVQDSIDRATNRLAKREEYYTRMFSTMESSMSNLQSKGSWLSSQLGQLGN